MGTVIGPAGIPIGCDGSNVNGLKHSIKLGLGAYEVEFVRGVRMSPRMAREMRGIREKDNIKVSCHAPYYINCNNTKKYSMTKRHLHDCLRVNQHLRFTHIVFHPGFLMGMKREQALKNVIATIKKIVKEACEKGYDNFTLGPETVGKHSQVGTVEELITICKECPECRPVIDWGHLNAFSHGGLKTREDFLQPLSLIRDELGKEYLKGLHCHFSEVEYGSKGEVKHHPLGSKWGPDFKVLAELIKEKGYDFSIICETPLIEEDALRMKRMLMT